MAFTLSQFGTLASQFYDAIWGGRGRAVVTPDTALTFPPIWYAVSKISGHIGQLPLVLHRRVERGTEVADNLPAYRLMKVRPNGWQTPMVFKRQMQTHALLWGNSYAYTVRRGSNVTDLYPLDPARMGITIYQGQKYYVYLSEKDEPLRQIREVDSPGDPEIPNSGGLMVLTDDDILHIPGLGFDGYAGFSLWKVASENWSIGLNSDRMVSKGFQKGFKSAMLLEAPPGAFRDEGEAKKFVENFNAFHSGADNADRVGMLREGVKANVVSMSGADAQVVENRKYSRQDAALWFLLETILGDDASVSYNSLEQKNLGYLMNCLSTWLVLWEQECNRKLLTEREQVTHYFKFHDRALLRTSHKEQLESLSRGIQATIYSPNEAREFLDMNPYEGGDEFGNPAITVKDQPEPTEDIEAAANRRAVSKQMEHMLGVEASRVASIAAKPNKFIDSIEAYYDGWRDRIAAMVGRFGYPPEMADSYCESRKARLIDVAGAATPEGLAAAVAAEVATWSESDIFGANE